MSDTDTPTPPPVSKTEIINEIATAIRERRHARGLTLEKVFHNIRIRIPYLESIEKGRWDELPGDVYIRGFIKRYADHIGLDGEKLLEPYFAIDKSPEKKAPDIPQILKGAEITRFQLIGVGLAAIVVILIIQLIKRDGRTPNGPAKETSVMVSSATATNAVASASSVTGEQHVLEVFTPLSLWLRVTSKDKNFEGFIPQGATWTWKGEGVFTLRLGHTRELSVHFDGKPVKVEENQKKIELPVLQ